MPEGGRLPPLHDFAVLLSNFDGQSGSRQLPDLIRVELSQLLVAIALDPEDRETLDVCICDRGRELVPDHIRFIGPGLLTLPEAEGGAEPFDATPQSRAFRAARRSRTQGALGERLYERVGNAQLLVVGAGGGGSELTRQLASLSPRRLVILDPDAVGPENLNAMPHAAESDAAERAAKVDVLLRAMGGNQPDLWLSTLRRSITDPEGSALLAGNRFDTVFSFVDNNAARVAAGWLCSTSQTVHLDAGSLIRFDEMGQRVMRADIRLFEPGRGCVSCVPPMRDLDDALYEWAAPPGAMHRGRQRGWQQDRAGSLLSLNSLAASLAVDLWLGYLDGRVATSHWTRVRWPFGEVPVIDSAHVAAADNCRLCRGASPPGPTAGRR